MNCPWCGKQVSLTKGRQKQRDSDGVIARLFGNRTLHTEVAAQTWAPPRPGPVTGSLEPGESREETSYRPLDMGDVLTSLAFAGIGGLLTFLASMLIFIPIEEAHKMPWGLGWHHGSFAVSALTLLGFFLVSSRSFLANEDHVIYENKIKRADPNAPAKNAPRPYRAQGEVKIGTKTIFTEFDITDAQGWHKFCRAVNKGRNFSGNEAERWKVDRDEFDRIVGMWADPDPERALVDPKTVGERKTPQLTRAGKVMVRVFAETAP